jgi:hypothetical protein
VSASSAEQLDALLSALDKLPPYRGLSYRGYAVPDGSLRPRTVVSAVLVPTSRDPRVATDNFSTSGVYAVISSRGRDLATLSRHPHEQEVVFRPGSLFLPIETFDAGGLEVSVVEEIDPDRDRDDQPEFTLEQLEDQMRAAIEDARGRPPFADVTPGKFVGPLT